MAEGVRARHPDRVAAAPEPSRTWEARAAGRAGDRQAARARDGVAVRVEQRDPRTAHSGADRPDADACARGAEPQRPEDEPRMRREGHAAAGEVARGAVAGVAGGVRVLLVAVRRAEVDREPHATVAVGRQDLTCDVDRAQAAEERGRRDGRRSGADERRAGAAGVVELQELQRPRAVGVDAPAPDREVRLDRAVAEGARDGPWMREYRGEPGERVGELAAEVRDRVAAGSVVLPQVRDAALGELLVEGGGHLEDAALERAVGGRALAGRLDGGVGISLRGADLELDVAQVVREVGGVVPVPADLL